MSQFRKNNILVGDIGNTETKIFFRNNKIEKDVSGKSIKYVVLWDTIIGLKVKIKAAHIPVSFCLIILQNS